MFRGVLLVAAVIALAGGSSVAAAAPNIVSRDAASDTAKGTKLVERFFDLLVDGDGAELEKFLSPAFQLQGADGGFLTKADFLDDPPEVESYELDELRVTRMGDVIVVRYDVTAVVTIDGTPQSRDPAPRLSVFTKSKKRWQLVAHANFNVPEATPQQ